jgi:hypothetical protein
MTNKKKHLINSSLAHTVFLILSRLVCLANQKKMFGYHLHITY